MGAPGAVPVGPQATATREPYDGRFDVRRK